MDSKNLEKIHPKFADEFACVSCGGHHLSKDKTKVQCDRCIEKGRQNPLEVEKDVIYKETNVEELSKQVAELQAKIIAMETEKAISIKETPKYKPISCADCGKEFNRSAPAQKICSECREKLTG